MLCSRCVLPVLAFYLLLEEISAVALPSRLKNKRDVHWPDLESMELIPRLPDRWEQRDLSVGDEGVTGRVAQSETLPNQQEHLPLQRQHQHQHQYQHHRKSNEKSYRRKITPLDTIGSFQMASIRNRKNEPEPDLHWEDPTE